MLIKIKNWLKRPTKRQWIDAGLFFLVQIFNYAVICYNWRAVAHGDYFRAISSDIIYSGVNFKIFKRIAKSEDDTIGLLAYMLGSAVGTALGITTSKMW